MDNKELNGTHASRCLIQNNGSFKESRRVEECKGCMALTSTFLCDLGIKTELILNKGIRVGIRPLGSCAKPEEVDDYLLEHLKKL